MTSPESPPRRKRTQRQRSDATTARLKQATIELLYEVGLRRLTTPEIARRAGVSRGALTHHFDGREAIVTAAIQSMLEATNERVRAFGEQFAEHGGSSDQIVDFLWEVMSDRLFIITMEYLPETRHDAHFRQGLIPVVRVFHDRLDDIWKTLARLHDIP